MALDIEGGQRPSKWATDKRGAGQRVKLKTTRTPVRGRPQRIHWGQERTGFVGSYVTRCGMVSSSYEPCPDQETTAVDCPRCVHLGG